MSAVAKLMNRLQRVVMAGIDHLPENRLAQAFANKFAGRVYIISYATDNQRDILQVDDQQRRASVRRTEAIDAAQEFRVRAQREYLPQDLPSDFVQQLCANVRSVEQDERVAPRSRCSTAPTARMTGCSRSCTRSSRTSAGGSASRSTTRRSPASTR